MTATDSEPISGDLNDHDMAKALAVGAGRVLMRLRSTMHEQGRPPWSLKDAGDRAAHVYLMSQLAELRPNDAVLSEEGRDNLARLDAERVWIVDPLDGTREYSEVPRHDWAVHVALVVGGVPIAGAVSLPALDTAYSTAASAAQLDLPPLRPLPKRPRMVVSRTRPLLEALALAERLDGELIPMGSAGAKAMAVMRGEADVYAHAGGQYEWDSCAPVAVAQAAGLHCSRLDGSPLVYNQADTWLPDLLICHPDIRESVQEILAELGW